MREKKFHWVTTIPAVFMTVVVTISIANSGIGAGVVATVAFFWKGRMLVVTPAERPEEN